MSLVDKLKQELAKIEQDNQSIEQQIAGLEVKYDAVKTTVSQLENAQKTLQGQLSSFNSDGNSADQCNKLEKSNEELKKLIKELEYKKKRSIG